MSIFVDNKLQTPTNAQTTCLAWSNADVDPLLAVASTHFCVSFYHEEGDLGDERPVQRSCLATCMSWHPRNDKLLAVGWEDGAVSIWLDSDQREDTFVHRTSIQFVNWSPEGSRLVSGDEGGILAVWKVDAKGRLTYLVQYELSAAITICTFRAPNLPPPRRNEESTVPCPMFFFGGEQGVVRIADDAGRSSEMFTLGVPLAAMLYYDSKDQLIVISKNLILARYHIATDGSPTRQSQVKLSSSVSDAGAQLSAMWALPGLLVTSHNEDMLRVWNLDQDDTYVLCVSDVDTRGGRDKILSVEYNPRKRVIAVGTARGNVVMWQYLGSDEEPSADTDWQPLPIIGLENKVTSVVWGPGEQLIAASTQDSVSVLHECVLSRRLCDGMAAIQLTASSISVESHANQVPMIVNTSIRIKGVAVTGRHLVVYSGKKVEVFDIYDGGGGVQPYGSFNSNATSVAIYNEHLYLAVGSKVEICNLNGSVQQQLLFSDNDGDIQHVDVSGNYLVVASRIGLLKLWDISRREPKILVSGRRFEDGDNKIGDILSIRVNSAATFVSVLCMPAGGQGIPALFVYDVDSDVFKPYQFLAGRVPTVHTWDPVDPRLLGVETTRTRGVKKGADDRKAGIEVLVLLATSDMGVLLQDSFVPDSNFDSLISLSVPYIFFASKMEADASQDGQVVSRLLARVMRDFVGMENVDDSTRNALLNFSYCLTIGNMDEAYKAVKLIKSSSVWENMAHMCVKTRRLDVAEVCLGQMGLARGARAVRESSNEPELDARVAMVALQLGLNSDAERLYTDAKRYDLLCQFYQMSGQWEKAVAIAETKDRIHLRAVRYKHARHLESMGDINGAIAEYEASETHRYEVPRMLFDLQYIDRLELYVKKSDDPEIMKWWAQYCESTGAYDSALHYYERADDFLSLVRVLCYRGDYEQAEDKVGEAGKSAAAYHLARQYEGLGKTKKAIEFYSRAQRYNHAIRLAKEYDYDNEIMHLALQAPSKLQLECAKFFEDREMFEKAALLFQKAGYTNKALDMCIRSQLFEQLRTITEDLGDNADPEILSRCGEFFLEHRQYDKAVDMLVACQQFNKALNICQQHNVIITDDMANKMTVGKDTKSQERINLLHRIAKVCKKQGSYHLATKKFTQAGMKVKAMKSLIKSGDSEKIIFFAGLSKQKEVFILAGNYLQTLDWHNDPEIMRNIINFYTKAKAYDLLAVFYEACAQAEIDDYRDYDKALNALRESLKYLEQASTAESESRVPLLAHRIQIVSTFVEARKKVKSDPQEMLRICLQLLDQPDVESAIRVGDVFALLIECHYGKREFQEAYALIEKMRARRIILAPYLDQEMVDAIHNAMGIQQQPETPQEEGVGEELEEEIEG